MDVTPQELRDIEIRESFRGYHRDVVDELLERAAATIEHLEHQIRILQERLASQPAARREREREP
ncbi:MAG: DivIVA domain-containing protein, partial [Actinobacteria bacterium]|nr:DivIVA domain-containing protein [Actinomycetota bacterium]